MRRTAGLWMFVFLLAGSAYCQEGVWSGGLLRPAGGTEIVLKEAVVNLRVQREKARYVTGITEYVFWNPGEAVTLPVRFAVPGPAGISPEEPGIVVEGKRIPAAEYRKTAGRHTLPPLPSIPPANQSWRG